MFAQVPFPAMSHGCSLDLLPSRLDLLPSPKVDIFGREIVKRFVVALRVVVFHERADRGFKLPGEFIIPQSDLILHRTVIALDLPLGHRVVWCTPDMIDVLAPKTLL
jgi:hypothetical protein